MYLVVGATGTLGGAITTMLLAQGKPVRILARPQSHYKPLAEAGAQVMLGDLKQQATLGPACKGIEAVITTANSAQRGGDDNVQSVDVEGNRNLIDAAKAAGVQHLLFMSAAIADPDSPSPFLAAKANTEEYLRTSGLPYTVLAPNAFMEFWIAVYVGLPALQERLVTIVGQGQRRHSFIAATDVVQFTLASITNPTAMNRKLVLGGPEPFSFRDAVAVYERTLSRSIPVRYAKPGDTVPGLPESAWGLAAFLDTFDSPVTMTETARTFGVKLTSLEEFVRRQVGSARAS
jgi:uncharacterized protein YbjT (DUF2867 family)